MPFKKPAPKADEPKPRTIKQKSKPKPKVVMYASKRLSLYHPYQNIRFNPGVPTACTSDSWLESQIKAGLINKV
jgi:hypothetical protein